MDNLVYEKEYLLKGYNLICGCDEVGRGPLAGPVVCAAVIMPLDADKIIEGVTDSKKLSEKKRELLNDKILQTAISYSICEIDNNEIDKINILNATKKCMYNAINSLKVKPQYAFIDAVKLELDCPSLSIIKGDLKSYSIACASIIAKVYRDRLMVDLDKTYSSYGFAKNKGYGTKVHIQAIKEVGACPIHRKTFIKNFLD